MEITLEQLKQLMRELGEATLELPPHADGRQGDDGAELVYLDTLFVHRYTDPRTPGVVYTLNPTVMLEQRKLQARVGLSIENGRVGPRTRFGGKALEQLGAVAGAFLALHGAGVLPGSLLSLARAAQALKNVTGRETGLLDQLLGNDERQKDGA